MNKKIISILMGILLIAIMLPINGTVSAGDEENPEVEDRINDVFGFLPYSACISIDMVSAWFYEDSSHPDYLYLSLKTVDIDAKVKYKERSLFSLFQIFFQRLFNDIFKLNMKIYQRVYAVSWRIDDKYYVAVLHGYSDGIGDFIVGRSPDGDDEIEDWYYCDGTFDIENNIITWEISKNQIDDPEPGNKVTYISPHTHLRHIYENGRPTMDYSKDVALNAKVIKDYIIQY